MIDSETKYIRLYILRYYIINGLINITENYRKSCVRDAKECVIQVFGGLRSHWNGIGFLRNS